MTVRSQSTRSRAMEWIAAHPVASFFTLAFAFSWVFWFIIPQSHALSNFGVYGPAFAAVLLSALLGPARVAASRAAHWALFAAVFIVVLAAWMICAPILSLNWGWLDGALVALFVALLASGPLADRRGVRELLAGWIPRLADIPWYVGAVVLGIVLYATPVVLDLALGGDLPAWPLGAPTLLLVLGAALNILFFDGGMEETGWRGFVQPRLQQRYSPLVASLVIGFFWTVWHLPLYVVGMYTDSSSTGPSGLMGMASRFVWVLPLAIVFTWVYNRCGKSKLATMWLLHGAFNVTTAILPLSGRAAVMFLGTMWLFALVAIVTGTMWKKLQPAVPAVEPGAGLPAARPGLA